MLVNTGESERSMAEDPLINDRYPIRESLSPPHLDPVYECAEAVHVSGFVPHAIVRVIANGTDVVGEDQPDFGFADITLRRRVSLGETLSAVQIVPPAGITSAPSTPSVTVLALPENTIRTIKPVVGTTLYECGQVVPVSNLAPGCRVHVVENGAEVGAESCATDYLPVHTAPLHRDGLVTAQQIGCEGSEHEVKGLLSDPAVKVLAAPAPVPAPQVDKASLIVGNDAVTLTGLLVGATAEVFSGGISVGRGLATDAANWVPVSPRLTAAPVTATQTLCANTSVPSAPQTPEGTLTAPVAVGPICHGARHVIVRDTILNATVVVLRNGSPVAYGGAAPGGVVLELGSGQQLNSGDVIRAVQYIGVAISPLSQPVSVVRRLSRPAIEILGGHPFFDARTLEKPIDGPVFPRGSGAGPTVRLQACCTGSAHLRVEGPFGQLVAEPTLTELYPGYYGAQWPWTSADGWAIPRGVPVGRYTVIAHADCVEQEARAVFYVIFDPDEVAGPPRFSFDATAVWFAVGYNSTRALHYYLHPSDARVFALAINAINGATSAYDAAHTLARKEESLFTYTTTSGTNDVIDQIVNRTEAQCADDACVLVAMLRAMGIPAHPVTADAGAETGAINWGFDTWLEFLASHAGATEWRVFHPHQYPNEPACSRHDFGNKPVATKSTNDIIVMAGETWPSGQLDDGTADVSYSRNVCGEPNQQLTKAPWIDELCEAGYWTQTHWDCAGVHTNTLTTGAGFRIAGQPLRFAHTSTGTLEITNNGTDTATGTLIIELLGHRAEVMAVAELIYSDTRAEIALNPGESRTVTFELPIPATLAPGVELLLRAEVDEQPLLLERLHVPVGLVADIDWPAVVLVDDRVRLAVSIRNISEHVVTEVTVDLDAPFALVVHERTQHNLGSIRPGETRTHSWLVHAEAPLDSGSLHISVASDNGGSLLLRKPFRITDPRLQTARSTVARLMEHSGPIS